MPTLGAILSAIWEAIGEVRGLRDLLGSLGIRLSATAQEHSDYLIESNVNFAVSGLMDATSGLSAAHTERGAILSAIGGITFPDPVNLPTTPPAGYGGASASDVWEDYNIPYDTQADYGAVSAPYTIMSELATDLYLRMMGPGYQWSFNNDFDIVCDGSARQAKWEYGWYDTPPADALPTVDWAQWDGTQSLVAFLNSLSAPGTFSGTNPWGVATPGYAWATIYSPYGVYARCRWHESMLPQLSGKAFDPDWNGLQARLDLQSSALVTAVDDARDVVNAHTDVVQGNITSAITASEGVVTGAITASESAVNGHTDSTVGSAESAILDAIAGISAGSYLGPPVWPGLAGATLGSPVALSILQTITGTPMDGVLLNVTGLTEAKPGKTLGSTTSGYNYARYAFISDNGYQETWRPVPNLHAILTPQFMRRASGIALAWYTTPTGTVTPWTVA